MTRLLRLVGADEVARPRRALDAEAMREASRILEDVQSRGEAAVLEHARRFGDIGPSDPVVHDRGALRAALDGMPREDRGVLERAAGRIRAFAEAQRSCLTDLDVSVEGGRAGHSFVPVERAGCYAPGGRFPLPSSVLMTVIPARVAGVKQVWCASPRPAPATLAAAAIAGADGLLAVGGVQAIGAMASGLCGVPACDVIVGPGNRYVTAAKFLVSDRVGIDMLAGPSELLVLADETADAGLVAADLLAQAEHDDAAVPMLVTTDATLPDRVEPELRRQLEALPTREIAGRSLRNGFAIIAQDVDRAVVIADQIAPEHLEIITRDAEGVAARVRHAGAVFVGLMSAEVFGDYGAGPNHVLPTGGTARFRVGLSVLTFLRPRTWLRIDAPAPALIDDCAALARMESLEGHAQAAEIRASV